MKSIKFVLPCFLLVTIGCDKEVVKVQAPIEPASVSVIESDYALEYMTKLAAAEYSSDPNVALKGINNVAVRVIISPQFSDSGLNVDKVRQELEAVLEKSGVSIAPLGQRSNYDLVLTADGMREGNESYYHCSLALVEVVVIQRPSGDDIPKMSLKRVFSWTSTPRLGVVSKGNAKKSIEEAMSDQVKFLKRALGSS